MMTKFNDVCARVLNEVKPGVQFTQNVVKKRSGEDELSDIIVELSEFDSSYATKLAKQFQDLKNRKEKIDEENKELKKKFDELDDRYFDPVDWAYSRILKTASAALKFAKMVDSVEIKETTSPDKVRAAFKEIADKFGEQIPTLREALSEIEKKTIAVQQIAKKAEEKRRVPSVDLNESALSDVVKSLINKAKELMVTLRDSIKNLLNGVDETNSKILDKIKSAKALANA